jgi:hypothetical protein
VNEPAIAEHPGAGFLFAGPVLRAEIERLQREVTRLQEKISAYERERLSRLGR